MQNLINVLIIYCQDKRRAHGLDCISSTVLLNLPTSFVTADQLLLWVALFLLCVDGNQQHHHDSQIYTDACWKLLLNIIGISLKSLEMLLLAMVNAFICHKCIFCSVFLLVADIGALCFSSTKQYFSILLYVYILMKTTENLVIVTYHNWGRNARHNLPMRQLLLGMV